MTLVAGVDSSTQSCKVVVRDLETGELVRSGRAAHPDGTEVDPGAWWAAFRIAAREAGGLEDVAAVSIAGQQHGLIALDAEGRVIRPALLWNDTRSAAAARALVEEVGAAEYAARAGSVPVASFTAAKLRWLRDAEPASLERVAAVALPHDWLTWRLLGYGPADDSVRGPDLAALTTDRSDASGTGYWSPAAGRYDPELVWRAAGRRGIRLPRVLGPAEPAGRTAGDHTTVPGAGMRLPEGLLVGPGAGDNAAAALGLGAIPGDVVVSIGTSGTVFAVSETPVSDETGTVDGFADASGEFLPLIATLNAARVLSTVAELLGVGLDELSALAAAATPGADGVVLIPYFAGERTPDLPEARASLHGLSTASATRENLARAAVEGMLCGLADGLDSILRFVPAPRRLLLIGGAAQSAAVRLVASQVFEAQVCVPSAGEYVADGAAVQAGWALTGVRPDWALGSPARLDQDYRPGIREQYARISADVRTAARGVPQLRAATTGEAAQT